ncbi:MAG: hypothetical protein R3E08_09810 [Thiotrichaceae bacterium]
MEALQSLPVENVMRVVKPCSKIVAREGHQGRYRYQYLGNAASGKASKIAVRASLETQEQMDLAAQFTARLDVA